MKKSFNQVLHELIKKSGLSIPEIAMATGINMATIASYLRENGNNPSLRSLETLADYFAVSIDALVGRCDDKIINEIMSNYERRFMELRRAPYEAYLIGRKVNAGLKYEAISGESPWPYNLLNAVLGEDAVTDVVDSQREEDIVDAIHDNLKARNAANVVLAHYRDGRSISKIAEMYCISGSFVCDLISKSLRTLQTPSLKLILQYGKAVAERESANLKKEAELIAKESELLLREEAIAKKANALQGGDSEIRYNECHADLSKLSSISIDPLNLPRRMATALEFAGINNLGDLASIIQDGDLKMIRRLNEESVNLVLTRFNEFTNLNYNLDGSTK